MITLLSTGERDAVEQPIPGGRVLLVPNWQAYESDNESEFAQMFTRELLLSAMGPMCNHHFEEYRERADMLIELAGYIGHAEAMDYFNKNAKTGIIARRLMQERGRRWL